MASITKEYLQALRDAKLLSRSDTNQLAALSVEKGLRDGRGYSRESFKNFIYHHFTTTEEVVEFIMNFYQNKKLKEEQLKKEQESFVKKLKEEVA